MAKNKIVHVAGKRKTSVARATIKVGEGKFTVNRMPIDLFEPEIARLRLKEPIILAGKQAEKVDISVNVTGGGWSSQVEAARLAVAKGLVDFTGNDKLEDDYLEYDRNLLVADTRRREKRKPMTHSKARSKRQKSYR